MRARRRLRVLGLRGLRVLKRHHFSLLSAAVMAGALGFVLTSGSFDVARPEITTEAAIAAPIVVATTTPATFVPTPARPASARQRLVVYYIVESLEQWDAIAAHARAEMLFLEYVAEQPVILPLLYFLFFETEVQEANGLRFLNEIQMLAPNDGVPLKIIDLRP